MLGSELEEFPMCATLLSIIYRKNGIVDVRNPAQLIWQLYLLFARVFESISTVFWGCLLSTVCFVVNVLRSILESLEPYVNHALPWNGSRQERHACLDVHPKGLHSPKLTVRPGLTTTRPRSIRRKKHQDLSEGFLKQTARCASP